MKTLLTVFSVFALAAVMTAQTSVPAGTVFAVTLNTSVDAKSSNAGQPISAKVAQDIPLMDGTTIKAGTRVLGQIMEAQPPKGSQPAVLTLRFDRIENHGRSIPLTAALRALASPSKVDDAQTSTSGDDRGTPPKWDQTTEQIGGDVVYRGGGPVARGVDTVGTPVYAGAWGVLARVAANSDGGCRGTVDGNEQPQPLWVFSHDACGVYGYDAVIAHAGRTAPVGVATLKSTAKDLKLRAGTALLLRVESTAREAADAR